MKEASHLFLSIEATGWLQGKSEKGHWSPFVPQGGREREENKREDSRKGRGRHGEEREEFW